MIEAIVFDFDGLILETERPQCEAWRKIYAMNGRELPEQAWLEVMGKPVKIDLFPRRLAKELNRELDIDAVIAQYRDVVAEKLDQPTCTAGRARGNPRCDWHGVETRGRVRLNPPLGGRAPEARRFVRSL